MVAQTYSPAWWLPGPHARTSGAASSDVHRRSGRESSVGTRDDGDFIDLVRLDAAPGRPHLVILHGLEGTPRSHYARGLFLEAARRGWAADLLIFRGCGERAQSRPAILSLRATRVTSMLSRGDCSRGSSLRRSCSLAFRSAETCCSNGLVSSANPALAAHSRRLLFPFRSISARASRHIGTGSRACTSDTFLQSLRRKALAKLERYPRSRPT